MLSEYLLKTDCGVVIVRRCAVLPGCRVHWCRRLEVVEALEDCFRREFRPEPLAAASFTSIASRGRQHQQQLKATQRQLD